MKQIKNQAKGFTIIEVVLVLAIAGLIFLMVFIALPALQRNQRDTARKNEASKVLSAITSYQSNNRGSAPDASDIMSYLDAKVVDGKVTMGSGTTVSRDTTTAVDVVPGNATNDNIVYIIGKKCGDGGKVADGTGRQAAAFVKLENGNAVFCQES